MGKPELHHEKYEMFLADAMNESVSHPMRTEAYFLAAFHLIENQIRPGQLYGSKLNGKQLQRVRQCFETIRACVERASA